MGIFPGVWFAFSAVIGFAFWAFLIWIGWVLVTSVKGIHTELTAIREELEKLADFGR